MAEPRPWTGSVLHPETESILEAAAEFLWSADMEASLEAFSRNYAPMFVDATALIQDSGHKLEWTQAHKEFQELFEFQLEQFISSQPFSQDDFVGACQDALDHGAAGTTVAASLVEMVLMTGTYDFFVQMMSSAAAELTEVEDDRDIGAE